MMAKKPPQSKIDTQALLVSVDIVQVIERAGVGLKKAGSEFEALCPFHSEKTPSFKVVPSKQFYYCFGCDANGDAIEFVRAFYRVDFKEACTILSGGEPPKVGGLSPKPAPVDRPAEKAAWTPILPVPAYAPKPPREHPFKERRPTLAVYPYYGASGELLGYTYRLPKSRGGKTVEPLVWARDAAGVEAWRWLSFSKPRPLYGLDRLAAKSAATVLVVEGEKCADVGHAELPELAVVSWPGGGKVVNHADWSPLAGRRVVLFADNDAKRVKLTPQQIKAGLDPVSMPMLPADEQPGNLTMDVIMDILRSLDPAPELWRVEIPSPDPERDGWDIADMVANGLTGIELANWLRRNSHRVVARDSARSASEGTNVAPGDFERYGADDPSNRRGDAAPFHCDNQWPDRVKPPDVIEAASGGTNVAPEGQQNNGYEAPAKLNKDVINVDFEKEAKLRKWFLNSINESDDFEVLVYSLAVQVELSALRSATKHNLLKAIAKKAGISMAALAADANGPPPSGGDPDGENDAIADLNRSHAIIDLAGKIRILREKTDPRTGRVLVNFMHERDFELLYKNRTFYLGREPMELGKAWLQHPQRREFSGIEFNPDSTGNDPTVYNMWQGFAIYPEAGNLHERYLYLIRDSICAGNAEAYEYVIRWMAHLVQNPSDLPGSALVLRSGQRTGKGTFVKMLGHLIGKAHFAELSTQKQLTGDFQGHLANALLVHASEALWGGDKRHEGVIKAMITDSDWCMEKKGVDAIFVDNFKHLIISTNNDFPIPRDLDDARFVVLDVADEHKEDWEFFEQLLGDMDSGGLASLMYFLLNDVNIAGWHPREIPLGLRMKGWDIKINSTDSFTRWWFDCLWRGWVMTDSGANGPNTPLWPQWLVCDHLRNLYYAWCRTMNIPSVQYLNLYKIGIKLADFGIHRTRSSDGDTRPWVYNFPDIADARADFGKAVGIPADAWEQS